MVKIKELKNKEEGKTIFIVANGSSILKQDLSFLEDEVVIGMNGTPFIEAELKFSFDYYVVSDVRFLQEPHKFECATTMLNKNAVRVFRKELENVDALEYKDSTYYIRSLGRDGFSLDLSRGFYFGCTTTMLAIQLAYYLGAKDIVILGCDLSYPDSQPRFYKEVSASPVDNFTGVQIKNIRNAFFVVKRKEYKFIQCIASFNA